jgi:large subunit ribosomal protein L4
MATVKTYAGAAIGTREVDESKFTDRVLGRTLKEVIVMYEANLRQGTHKTKERPEVAGSQKKLYRQKHTGRSRAGDIRSGVRRGGGKFFGPRPRDYSYAVPKKQRRAALASALFGKLQDGEVIVADGFPRDKPSTKDAVKLLRTLDAHRGALVVSSAHDPVLVKSLRNVPGVDVMVVNDLNARAVLLRKWLVFTPAAFDALMARDWSQKKAGQARASSKPAGRREVKRG